MPELARREWEHLFEPWFANEAPCPPAVKTQVKGPEAIFDEASQPLAVRRKDFVRRQSPIGRATESRSGNVAADVERLVGDVALRRERHPDARRALRGHCCRSSRRFPDSPFVGDRLVACAAGVRIDRARRRLRRSRAKVRGSGDDEGGGR